VTQTSATHSDAIPHRHIDSIAARFAALASASPGHNDLAHDHLQITAECDKDQIQRTAVRANNCSLRRAEREPCTDAQWRKSLVLGRTSACRPARATTIGGNNSRQSARKDVVHWVVSHRRVNGSNCDRTDARTYLSQRLRI